jgi:hypothetical protein
MLRSPYTGPFNSRSISPFGDTKTPLDYQTLRAYAFPGGYGSTHTTAAKFSGTLGQYLRTSEAIAFDASFTISVWRRPYEKTGGSTIYADDRTYFAQATMDGSANNGAQRGFVVVSGDVPGTNYTNGVKILFYPANGLFASASYVRANPADGATGALWSHLLIAFNLGSGTVSIYFDGVLSGTQAVSGSIPSTVSNTHTFKVGGTGSSWYQTEKAHRDCAVWIGTVADQTMATEIFNLGPYQGASPTYSIAPTHRWVMDEASGTRAASHGALSLVENSAGTVTQKTFVRSQDMQGRLTDGPITLTPHSFARSMEYVASGSPIGGPAWFNDGYAGIENRNLNGECDSMFADTNWEMACLSYHTAITENMIIGYDSDTVAANYFNPYVVDVAGTKYVGLRIRKTGGAPDGDVRSETPIAINTTYWHWYSGDNVALAKIYENGTERSCTNSSSAVASYPAQVLSKTVLTIGALRNYSGASIIQNCVKGYIGPVMFLGGGPALSTTQRNAILQYANQSYGVTLS